MYVYCIGIENTRPQNRDRTMVKGLSHPIYGICKPYIWLHLRVEKEGLQFCFQVKWT